MTEEARIDPTVAPRNEHIEPIAQALAIVH
jgi:hypothetical protein